MANSDGSTLSWSGIFVRFLLALVLVYATWNPFGGKSFVEWVFLPLLGKGDPAMAGNAPVKFLLGVVLVIGWVLYLQATRRSIGAAGSLLVAALVIGIVWLLSSWNVLALQGPVIAHALLITVALVLAMGMSWSHISRRMSGQVDTDTVE
ncbi:MAG TPA: DUF6524 family protein [Gemmatimonadales bacterium]|nr:DUF6524 family protein [Gemmatimonadales bacterium]